ncbi:bromodomain-containing protein [Gossypium australe]|uniref:Bromodomain-containing protein n=1 Tax=Gossypium australe TaxID=47621 RepID=A0A5B6WH92_9ROSI|nr:bromodomain-containing protein [Gossypium australe]
MGQLTKELRSSPQCALHSDIENLMNTGKQQCKVVTLRSRKDILTSEKKKFLDVLKKLHINIPLVEALEQMPNCAKFIKDIFSKKRSFRGFEKVALKKECSPLLQDKLPLKMKELGSFTILCYIGDSYCRLALCDLRASINLMPISIAHPGGKIEYVLVRVDKFIFPAEFLILDFKADKNVLMILGRPFLAAGGTLIDVQKRELTMRVQDDQVTFNVFKSITYLDVDEECSATFEMELLVLIGWDRNSVDDPSEQILVSDPPSDNEEHENLTLLKTNLKEFIPKP